MDLPIMIAGNLYIRSRMIPATRLTQAMPEQGKSTCVGWHGFYP